MKSYILNLEPAFKDYIWGGRRLIEQYGMNCSLDRASEAWVLSCHKDGPSIVKNGELAGKTLPDALELLGKDVLGTRGSEFCFFPVLIKLIDARNNLSVQVHPDDEYALKNEGEYGKTEMWYVVDHDEGAALYCGFKENITKDEYAKRIADGTLTDILNRVEVKTGDCFFIPSGTVHAIGAGMLIAEIQQNSNKTYRVYDYNRLGADGKPRELHIEKALTVSKLTPPEKIERSDKNVLADCKYFKTRKTVITENTPETFTVGSESFSALLCVSGSGTLVSDAETINFKAGSCLFIPASYGEIKLSGSAEVLLTTV